MDFRYIKEIEEIKKAWKDHEDKYQEIIWLAGKQVLSHIIKQDFDTFYHKMDSRKCWIKTEGFIPDLMIQELLYSEKGSKETVKTIEKLFKMANKKNIKNRQ